MQDTTRPIGKFFRSYVFGIGDWKRNAYFKDFGRNRLFRQLSDAIKRQELPELPNAKNPAILTSRLVDFAFQDIETALLTTNNWNILSDYAHITLEKGCDYLTSEMMTMLLGIELCSATEFRSLRYLCPVSCGCGTMEDCPHACQSDPPTSTEREHRWADYYVVNPVTR